MSTKFDPEIKQGILNQINSLSEGWRIIAYNNSTTLFQVVFYVLKTVVPLSEEKAYEITSAIHHEGMCEVYSGDRDHCHKIGDALQAIKVIYKIEKI